MLRPEPGASATIGRARALGLEAIGIPLFAITPLDWSVPEASHFDALLLTSANAVRCAGSGLDSLHSLPVHAVGSATGEAARQAGLEVASIGSGGIDQLLRDLPSGLRLLHLCGQHRVRPTEASDRIIAIPVYDSSAIASPEGLERLADAVVLVHSPRAGQRLAEVAPSRSTTIIAAISPAAAAACGEGWERVETAARPRDDALLSLGAMLCKHSVPK